MKKQVTAGPGNGIVAKNTANADTSSPNRSGTSVITFGIVCCTLAMAIVLLVGIASIL